MNNTEQKKLSLIDRHARRYSAERGRLSRRYAKFQRALDLVQQKHLPKIKAALDTSANVKSDLEQAITAAPELFKEPRTLTLHGVRVGFMEGKASVKLPRGKKLEAVVKAIREVCTPEAISILGLISRVTTDVPNADALLKHFTAAGNRLEIPGVEFVPAGDRVFIKPADHALDKVITKLLQEGLQKGNATATEEDEHAEAA